MKTYQIFKHGIRRIHLCMAIYSVGGLVAYEMFKSERRKALRQSKQAQLRVLIGPECCWL